LIFAFAFIAPTLAFAAEGTGELKTGIETGINNMVIMSSPTATPAQGAYTSAQSVALTGEAGTQSIHYTTNSSTVTCSSGTTYSTPISVTTSATIQAISCYPEGKDSGAVNFAYVISSNGGGGGGGGGGGPLIPSDNADFNNDGKVDIVDLNILSNHWGSTTATHSTGDADNNHTVDIFDLSILATQWTG